MPEQPVSLPPPKPGAYTQAALLDYFENTWALYDALFSAITDDDALYEQPDPLRHPLVFYVGHTAAFYINKLQLAGLLRDGIDGALEDLFARGVDPHSASELTGPGAWPDIGTVRRYRRDAHNLITDALCALSEAPVGPEDPGWSLFMGLEHDRIHLETSSMLLRQLDADTLRRPDGWQLAPRDTAPPALRWCSVPGQEVVLGRPATAPLFGWDNEHGTSRRSVAPLSVSAHLITNQTFHAFVEDGGYDEARLWSREGWAWRSRHSMQRPRFWVGPTEALRYRAMFEEIEMPWSWPVEVCAHEAEAFCRWLGGGARLPTEAEHHALAQHAPLTDGDVISHPGYNLGFRFTSPSPVDHFAPTPDGIYDAYGNVWQWLSDDFAPLPGFAAHPLYDDFSEPYFDADHATLRGGSWATTGAGASRFYRLWFRRHFYQHAGFRVAR